MRDLHQQMCALCEGIEDTLTAAGVNRANSLDLPPEAEAMRTEIRAEALRIAALDEKAQLDELIATGYLMPHWPKPWGRAAGAVEILSGAQQGDDVVAATASVQPGARVRVKAS